MLLEPADDPRFRVVAELATARQEHCVDALDQVPGQEKVRVASTGRATSDIAGGNSALRWTKNDCAAGGRLIVRPVAHVQAANSGQRVVVGQ